MFFTQKSIYGCIFLIFFGLIGGYSLGKVTSIGIIDTYIYKSYGNHEANLSSENIFITEKIKKTIELIRSNFYGFDKKNTLEIEDAILKSVVNGLGDKHSTYFTKKETIEFEEALRGDFEGIGAVINENPKGIKILKIIIGSPAEKAGLEAGDIMTKIGQESIIGKSTEEAVKIIRGPKGTIAEITYKRGDDNTELHVNVIRNTVKVPSVAEKMLDNKIGYIEIATFGEHTSSEFIKSWNLLTASGAKGIILDFRNNGGGYLETAVDLASIVLPKNSPVVTIKENNPLKNQTLLTRSRKNNNIIPIVVLINNYSASASEIFAGALQDHDRAILLGEKSYGKGSVQEPFDLGDGSIIKLTIARWYTPKDTSIDEKGIEPDIHVFLTNKDYENIFDRQLKAAEIVIQDQISMTGSIKELKEKYKSNLFTDLIK